MKIKKLVRDKIPEIYNSNSCYSVSGDEYKFFLKEKLKEEVKEFLQDESIEELADIIEVLEAFCILNNWTLKNVMKTKKCKKSERGGFEKKLVCSI